MDGQLERWLAGAPICESGQVLGSKDPALDKIGVYGAWLNPGALRMVPLLDCQERGELRLAYVGIARSETLRSRLRLHCRSNAEGSTLRYSLGCLLGLELRLVGTRKKTKSFGCHELALTEWLQTNARWSYLGLCDSDPADAERDLMASLHLPLNLKGNRRCEWTRCLRELRRESLRRARSLASAQS